MISWGVQKYSKFYLNLNPRYGPDDIGVIFVWFGRYMSFDHVIMNDPLKLKELCCSNRCRENSNFEYKIKRTYTWPYCVLTVENKYGLTIEIMAVKIFWAVLFSAIMKDAVVKRSFKTRKEWLHGKSEASSIIDATAFDKTEWNVIPLLRIAGIQQGGGCPNVIILDHNQIENESSGLYEVKHFLI